jgi:PAS domain S-box-containing protein
MMSGPDVNRTWVALALVVLLLLASSVGIIESQWKADLATARSVAERELGLLAHLVQDDLQEGNYQKAADTVEQWGRKDPTIVWLRLRTTSGFTLAEFERGHDDEATISLRAPISYSYSGAATIIFSKSLAPIVAKRVTLGMQLLVIVLAVTTMLAVLTRLVLLRDRESRRLEKYAEALQLTQYAIEQSSESFFWIDTRGQVFDINSKAYRSLGYTREEMIGLHVWDFDTGFTPSRWPSMLATMRQQGFVLLESQHRRKDGAMFPVEIKANYFRFGDNEYVFAFAHDITERLKARVARQRLSEELEERVQHRTAELIAAKNEAERASKAKSEFLSRMSHELRTPLNAILGFGQLLQMEPRLEEREKNQVNEIVYAGNHLLALINEVLDLARIETGRIDVRLEPVDIRQVVSDCNSAVTPQATQRQIAIHNHCRGGAEFLVMADTLRVRQVLLNFLSNSIKYSQPGGRIDVRCEPSDADRLRIIVQDDGRGIPADLQARVFQPFERLGVEAEAIDGTGIGLALSRHLATAMGGSIGFDSAVGAGSTFWIELPLAVETA